MMVLGSKTCQLLQPCHVQCTAHSVIVMISVMHNGADRLQDGPVYQCFSRKVGACLLQVLPNQVVANGCITAKPWHPLPLKRCFSTPPWTWKDCIAATAGVHNARPYSGSHQWQNRILGLRGFVPYGWMQYSLHPMNTFHATHKLQVQAQSKYS